MGEGFQSDKMTLSTNIWLYMYSHPLGYNWGGLGWGCRQTYGFICTPTLWGITGGDWGFRGTSRGTSRRHRKNCACQTKEELLGGIENIAPAAQKGSRATILAKHLHLPHKKELGSQATFRSVTENFSEASKRLHLPRKKEVGSQRTSRRHRKYCTCHKKSMSVTCDSSQQASIRSGDNISEASKLLHLPRKTHGKGHKLSIGSQAIRK